MNHKPNILDIKTDLRRGVAASYSPKKLDDKNVEVFVGNAVKNLNLFKTEIGPEKYAKILERISQYKNKNLPLEKRRENLLTASSLI